MPKAVCKRDCWDSEKCQYYYHGQSYEIDPSHTLSKHFKFLKGDEKPEEIKLEARAIGDNRFEMVEVAQADEKRGSGKPLRIQQS